MMKIYQIVFLFAMVSLLAACAGSPKFETSGIDANITPKRAVAQISTYKGAPVLWGGVIIASSNLKDVTQLEILAYPLDSYQSPDSNDKPLGRFLAIQQGYLETSDYAQGRLITVKGKLTDIRKGLIGETEYIYPVVNLEQLHLWPKPAELTEPRVRFGIGVMIRN